MLYQEFSFLEGILGMIYLCELRVTLGPLVTETQGSSRGRTSFVATSARPRRVDHDIVSEGGRSLLSGAGGILGNKYVERACPDT